MRSLYYQSLWDMTRGLVLVCTIIFSSTSIAQELTAALSLRLGPGIGYPVNIELPSGTDIVITQRRNSWLLATDERGEGGWAKISDVEFSGGLAERQAWRLSELKKKDIGDLQGRWFTNGQAYGLSLGWKFRSKYGNWLAEVEKAADSQSEWHSVAAWFISPHTLTNNSYLSGGIGLGYAQENTLSHVFSEADEASQTVFGGIELALGVRPVKQVDTGLSLRYLLAASSANADSTVISWYWSFGI